jgi:hypothetical protein
MPGVKRPGREANQLDYDCSYASTAPVCLQAVHTDSFTLVATHRRNGM